MPLLATAPAPSAIASFDDDAWEDLLNFVEEKRVIPIVGPELTIVQTDAGGENLYTWLARTLAARLGIPLADEKSPLTLNDVVVRHLAQRGRREDLYTRIRTIMRDASFGPSPAMLKLAEITDFGSLLTRPEPAGCSRYDLAVLFLAGALFG